MPNSLDPVTQTRSYARAYHDISKTRPNYHIVTGSIVTKLVLSGTTVTGVEVSNLPPKFNFRSAHFCQSSPPAKTAQSLECPPKKRLLWQLELAIRPRSCNCPELAPSPFCKTLESKWSSIFPVSGGTSKITQFFMLEQPV